MSNLHAVGRSVYDPYAQLGPPHDQDAARASWQVADVTIVCRAGSTLVEFHGSVETARNMIEVGLLKRCSDLPLTIADAEGMAAALADLGLTASEIGGLLYSCAIMAAGSVSQQTFEMAFDVIDQHYTDVSNELCDRGHELGESELGQPLYLPPGIGED
jgi:hypothetical protein